MSHTHIRKLGGVRREFEVTRAALDHVIAHWSERVKDADLEEYSLGDLRLAAQNLEVTYLIRLFSQFEAILRDFLREHKRRVPRIAEMLIDRVATLRRIEPATIAPVHDVRLYRNALVHEATQAIPAVDFEDALASLNHFLA